MSTTLQSRRNLAFVLAALPLLPHTAIPGPGSLEAAPLAGTRPNIVVITADDLNIGTLRDALRNGWMPQLRSQIIDVGITFADSFVSDSLCCPSRASFLTGQHTHNHGVVHNLYPDGGVTRLDDSSTLAVWLQGAGYRNGFVGKYLNGYGLDLSPAPGDDPTYVPPGWDDWQALLTFPMFNFQLNDNGTIVADADYQTDVLAARAAAFISEAEANDAQPFFLWITPYPPHGGSGVPCALNYGVMGGQTPHPRHRGIADDLALPRPPSFNEGIVTDKPSWLQSTYPPLTASHIDCLTGEHRGRVETMMAVDDLIGTVVAELQRQGELNDTLLVFTADNGFLEGEHRATKKESAYEEAIRVPLYVRGPGIPGPQTARQLVVGADVTATVVELAQATAGITLDGRSLVPILQDPGFSPWRSYFLIEHKQSDESPVPDYSAVRSARYLWVEYAGGDRELYDLAADPHQLTSQHANPAYKGVKQMLREALSRLEACAGSGCWQ